MPIAESLSKGVDYRLQIRRIWIGLLNLIYAMRSLNVLAQNDMQSVNFRLKAASYKSAKKPHYLAIIKDFVPTTAGNGRSAMLSCPA
jgi:hypothetical protein